MENKYISEERLKELFIQVVIEIRNLGIPISSRIRGPVINSRARARFGCCKAEKKTDMPTVYTIEISRKTLAAPENKIREIIAHELLHTCRGCMNHGRKWKDYTSLLRQALGYDITRTTTAESLGLEEMPVHRSSGTYKYRLVCQGCGAEILRQKRCKVVENPGKYRCGKCGGLLKLSAKNTTSCR